MNKGPIKSDWFIDFFSGPTLDVWKEAISPEQTAAEITFIEKVLAVSPGSQLLDVPCGNGRLSYPLEKLGYRVTGVDLCGPFIEEARSQTKTKTKTKTKSKTKTGPGSKSGTEVAVGQPRFIQADMRVLASTAEVGHSFAGAFCMGNSLGYFERSGTSQFFQAVAGCLEKGAKFIIDSAMVAECFLINGGQREWLQVGECYMLTENQYCFEDSSVRTTYTYIRPQGLTQRTAVHWIYTVGEISHMLAEAGFRVESLYSSCDFDPFELGADRLLLVACRK